MVIGKFELTVVGGLLGGDRGGGGGGGGIIELRLCKAAPLPRLLKLDCDIVSVRSFEWDCEKGLRSGCL